MPCCDSDLRIEVNEDATCDSGHYPIALNKNFATDAAKPSYAPHSRILPVHIRISLQSTETELKASRVPAAVSVTVRGHSGASGSAAKVDRVLKLNAVDLTINAVKGVDSWDHDGKILELHWAKGFDGEKVVDIDYVIEKPIAGLYFHVADEAVPDRALHVITDHETERARYWLPCVDVPLVRTTLEFVITHSTHHTAVANGAHISTTPNADNAAISTTIYKLANHTCPSYLICWAVGDFVTVDDGDVDGMKLQYLCSRDNEFVTPENLLKTFGKTGAIVRWMQEKVGLKFPWEKYYQIVSPRIEGGAMENISLVTYKDVYLFNDDLGKDGFGQAVNGTNVHEMAHTYFGDLITMRHFEHVWLKESWATYIDYCYYEDHYSHDEARLKSFTQMEGYISETARYMRPIVCRTYNSSWDLFDAHTYPGGAFRLHMLRWSLGDAAFWAAIKTYTNTFAGKSVETEDFKRVLEQQSGLNLTKFFDQWIYGRGYVKLKAEQQYDADRRMVQITLEQTQGDKALEVPAVFEVTIEVDVMDSRGEVYTTEVTFTDATGPKVVAFVAIGDAKPTVIEVDPRGKVLHTLDFNPGEAILEATAKKGIEVTSRIRAYRQLIKNGNVSALRKVSAALPQEPFYGVRAAVYTALENAKTQAAVDILAQSLTVETDPRALRVLAMSCTMKDAGIRTGLLAVLTTKPAAEVSPRTRRFAYENLGRQQHPADGAFLIQASESASTRDIHNLSLQGVLLGLGHHRSQEALQQLYRLLFESKMPENTLVVLVNAYASGALTQHSKQSRKDACEHLAQLVRAHPASRVRKASIRALIKMGDDALAYKSVCEAVAAVSFAEQDTLKLVAAVRTMGGAKNMNDLQKTVEELESKIKKVEAVVSLLEAKEKEAKEKEAKEKEAKEKEAKEKEVKEKEEPKL